MALFSHFSPPHKSREANNEYIHNTAILYRAKAKWRAQIKPIIIFSRLH